MRTPNKDRLREMQLAFVGKLMSGLSHESKNHLAIIRELNGLIEDLLMLEEPGQSANSERFKKNIAGIDDRIKLAAEMCRYLSSFSHRMDQPLSSFSVNDILQEEIYLVHRFARQKQVHLISSLEEDLPPIYNNPSLLQFTVFCILWPALESLVKDSRISIAAVRQDDAAKIIIHLAGQAKKPEDASPWHEMLPEALQILAAELSRTIDQDGNQQVTVTISSVTDRHNDR